MVELKILVLPTGRQVSYNLAPGESVSLGREHGDLRFTDDGQMSSFHLTLVGEDTQVRFQDEGSTNGTFLNGRRVASGIAGGDDELSIGQTRIQVLVRSEAKPKAKPPVVRETAGTLDTMLEVEGSGATLRQIRPGERLSVGRTDRADWEFPDDDLMSGLHFVLSGLGDRWEIIDARSSNGTFLNARRIEQAFISDGDVVTAGDTQFKLKLIPIPQRGAVDKKTPRAQYSADGAGSSSGITDEHTPAGDTHPSHYREVDEGHDHMWLVATDQNRTTLCIKKGSSLWLTHRSTGPHPPGIVIDWSQRGCRIWTAETTVTLKINDTETSQAELSDGDRVEYDGSGYQVLYTNDPRLSPWPASEPDFVAPPIPRPAQTAGAQSVPDATSDAAAVSKSPPPAEPAPLEPAKPSLAKVDASTGAAPGNKFFRGSLPSSDLIAILMDLLGQAPMWLVTIDGRYPTQPSVPVPVVAGDASWMLQVEACWPQQLFLILFGQTTAEEILTRLLEKMPPNFEFSASGLDQWLTSSPGLLGLSPIEGVLVLEGHDQSWAYYGDRPPF